MKQNLWEPASRFYSILVRKPVNFSFDLFTALKLILIEYVYFFAGEVRKVGTVNVSIYFVMYHDQLVEFRGKTCSFFSKDIFLPLSKEVKLIQGDAIIGVFLNGAELSLNSDKSLKHELGSI